MRGYVLVKPIPNFSCSLSFSYIYFFVCVRVLLSSLLLLTRIESISLSSRRRVTLWNLFFLADLFIICATLHVNLSTQLAACISSSTS